MRVCTAALVLFLILALPLCIADVGPSPSFNFSISNASDFPAYKFYYAGNIWPDKLERVDPERSVYKLNTHIKVYAVPNELATGEQLDLSLAESESVVSQEIDLLSGKTVFEVKNLSPESGTMKLEVKSNTSDAVGVSILTLILDFVVLAVFGLIVLAIIVAIIIVLKRASGKKK
ncbi:MAG: hypothetical protein ABH854_04100 [Candidatus Diapherotrites archaeon]